MERNNYIFEYNPEMLTLLLEKENLKILFNIYIYMFYFKDGNKTIY